MAKYVYKVPLAQGEQAEKTCVNWQEVAEKFAHRLAEELKERYGLCLQIFPREDGVEISDGSMGMGKEWFEFSFRVFAGLAVYIDMLNVPMEWRGKGIGFYVVEELKKFVREIGLGYIFLGSYDPANPFWEKCGFEKIDDYPDFVLGIDSMAK